MVVIDYFVVIKNKLTKEILELTYPELREKFVKEIYDVFKSYHKTQLNKYSCWFKDDNSLEFNFYFELPRILIILEILIGILKGYR